MKLLDLFCGAGGAAMGYYRAGFTEIVGIDIKPQPRYPFTFIQADALRPPVDLSQFDLIHASPPCQAHVQMSNRWRGKGTKADSHVSLITPTRTLLAEAGKPFVIENVPGSPLRGAIKINGSSFGLKVNRPRLFESNMVLFGTDSAPTRNSIGVYGDKPDGRRLWTRKDGSEQRAAKSLAEGQDAMGIDWAEWRELAEAIPPAYTEWIGRQLITQLTSAGRGNSDDPIACSFPH